MGQLKPWQELPGRARRARKDTLYEDFQISSSRNGFARWVGCGGTNVLQRVGFRDRLPTTLEALSSDQTEIFMLPKVELGALFRLLGSASKQPGHQPDRVHTPAISRHGSQRYLPTAWSRR